MLRIFFIIISHAHMSQQAMLQQVLFEAMQKLPQAVQNISKDMNLLSFPSILPGLFSERNVPFNNADSCYRAVSIKSFAPPINEYGMIIGPGGDENGFLHRADIIGDFTQSNGFIAEISFGVKHDCLFHNDTSRLNSIRELVSVFNTHDVHIVAKKFIGQNNRSAILTYHDPAFIEKIKTF